jgi:hypothetical protein
VLGTLRERELLAEIRIGWLHTDFFEGYFPRISKRIDLTFLGHPELETRWRAAGVPPEKVTTSGMPVQISEGELGTREDALRAFGLATDLPTILLTGGKEGTGDYCAVVESIARDCHRRGQIIAVARQPFPSLHEEIAEFFGGFGVELNVVADAYSPSEALCLVEQRIGVCLLDRSSTVLSKDTVTKPLFTSILTRKCGIFYREENSDPMIQRFVALIDERIAKTRL